MQAPARPGFIEEACGTVRHMRFSIYMILAEEVLAFVLAASFDRLWLLALVPMYVIAPVARKRGARLASLVIGVSVSGILLMLLYSHPLHLAVRLSGTLIGVHGLFYTLFSPRLRTSWEQQQLAWKRLWWESWLGLMENDPGRVLDMYDDCQGSTLGDLLDWVDDVRLRAAENGWEVREVKFPEEFLNWVHAKGSPGAAARPGKS